LFAAPINQTRNPFHFSFVLHVNRLIISFQEDRVFAPAPDVTRRMGSPKVGGKPEAPGSPPYYRSTSATSSSSNSASSSEYSRFTRISGGALPGLIYRDTVALIIPTRINGIAVLLAVWYASTVISALEGAIKGRRRNYCCNLLRIEFTRLGTRKIDANKKYQNNSNSNETSPCKLHRFYVSDGRQRAESRNGWPHLPAIWQMSSVQQTREKPPTGWIKERKPIKRF
jgi:hypothetical protein